MTSRIIHILTREAREEHNPFKWDLAKMLYALERLRDIEARPQPAPANPLRQDNTQ